jgi:DNA repair exonuclease SbcCD nuclease subunit
MKEKYRLCLFKINMAKIFVIGDPHFKINNIDETNEMSTKIIQLLDQIRPDAVVCLGDVLDRHETIHVGPLLRSIDFFEKIASQYKLYILIGNHDRPSNQIFLTEEHPFTALKHWKNTTIVDKVCSDTIHNKDFLFVPYVPPGRFMEAIQTHLGENPSLSPFSCIFAHQEFYGAKMGFVESKVGDVWSPEHPLVVSGHIHDFDELTHNIIYTGTPIQHGFGDRDDKMVFLFSFDENGFQYEKYDLNLPKKKIIRLSFSEIQMLKKLDPKSQYKIIISGTPEELKTIKMGPFLQHLPKSKIVYKTISSSMDKISRDKSLENKSFLEHLYVEIQRKDDFEEKKELIDLYQELFGSIKN